MGQQTIGIIAGVGALPVVAAREAKKQGYRCVVIGFFPENQSQLVEYADQFYLQNPSQFTQIIKTLQAERVTELVMLGKFSKELLYGGDFQPDAQWLALLQSLNKKNDDSIMLAIVAKLAELGITVLDQELFLTDYVLRLGVYTKRQPTPAEVADIIYGYPLAKGVAGLDIGQTVAVAKGAILAVEAIDGTNATIIRGGQLAKGPITVLKVTKPQQDKRFDIPVMGFDTIKSLHQAGGGVLAVEADQVFFLDLEKSIEYADAHNLTICAFNPRAIEAGSSNIFA